MEQIESKKKLKICYIPYYGYETGNYAFDKKFDQRWTNVLKKKLEAQGHSFATYDINTIKDSDYIISFDNTYFQNVRHFWNIWKAGKLGRTLHIDYEPPSAMAKIHSDRGLKLLSRLFTVMTYNDNVINGNSILKGVVGDFHEEGVSSSKLSFKKKKFACMIANNRNNSLIEQWPTGLYVERSNIAKYFTSNHRGEFDLYGGGWPDEFSSKGKVDRDRKIEVLSKYKFVISYDSITGQNGYISEKIFDAFTARIVPVYLGADNIADYIPTDCFIDRRDFKTNEELYRCLKQMKQSEYDRRVRCIEEYMASDEYKNVFSSEATADRIYEYLQRKPRHINYLFAGLVFIYFDIMRHVKPYYNWDNYYYRTGANEFNTSVCYVDKELHDSKYVFSIYVTVARDENIYLTYGNNKKYNRAAIEDSSRMGIYRDGVIRISYEDIYEKGGEVSFFVKKNDSMFRLRLNESRVVDVTDWSDVRRFKSVGNKIVIVRKRSYYVYAVKALIKKWLRVKKK